MTTNLDTLTRTGLTPKSRSLTLNLSALVGKKVGVRIVPNVTTDTPVEWGLSVIHHDTSGSQNGLVKQTPGEIVSAVPTSIDLWPNYPNPFNPSTTLEYQLPAEENVKLAVFDVLGRQMIELASGVQSAGYYSVRWDASSVASGIYYARFIVADELGRVQFAKVNKLLLKK